MPSNDQREFTFHPLLWLSISFALGVVTAGIWQLPLEMVIGIVVVFGLAASLIQQTSATSVLLLALFFSLGAICYNVEISSVSDARLSKMYDEERLVSGEPVEFEGTVIGMPEAAPDGYFITLETSKLFVENSEAAASGKLRLFAVVRSPDAESDFASLILRHGTRIRVACSPEREDRFLNPGVPSRVELLDRQGIDATATVKSPLLIEKLGRDPVFLPLAFVYERRANLIDGIRDQFSPSTAGVLIASMLGDKYFLDRQTADVFREGGTFHVLVISGLHITFIGGLILLVVRQFTNRRKLQAVIAVLSLWLYGIAVGGEAPVIRACVMFTIMMFGYGFYRSTTLLNAFGASALVLLVWRPSDLFDPSFQLTFLSIASIVAFGLPLVEKLRAIGAWTPTSARPFPPNVPNWLRRFCETIYWSNGAWEVERSRHIWSAQLFKFPFVERTDQLGVRRLITFLFEGIVISLAVQVWLLPLIVYYFHRVSVVSIFLNLWVGAVLAGESIAALIAVGLAPVSEILALPFETLTEILNWLLVSVPSVLTESGWASFRVPIYPGPFKALYLLYLVPVIAASVLLVRWDPFALVKKSGMANLMIPLISIVVLSSLIILHPFSAPEPDGNLHVDFMDVGQGDSALITFPNGETMLVDAGGRTNYKSPDESVEFEPDIPRIGEVVVSEFLWERGVGQVDHVVATHADADHIQGLVDVSKNFWIGKAYFGMFQTDPELSELLNVWHERTIPINRFAAGDVFEIGGARVEVLNPPYGPPPTMSSNNGSVVLRVIFGETEILLTGDIEAPAEEALLASADALASDVVKVPHHGSRTSSTEGFVRAVSPSIAIISVGRRSRFGHPHTEVVERWRTAAANVLTTGERGTISISTDGKSLVLKQFHSE